MNYNNNDIIIAQSTPIGSSALAVIRVSGRSLVSFLSLVFNKKTTSRYAYTIKFKGFNSKELIDTCVAIYYKGPNSFTGEDMIEISCHGNTFIVNKIINEFIIKGGRIAYPGEFSYRALQNNKIDLMQAEAISEKITTNSEAYGVALKNIENGFVSKRLLTLKDLIVNMLSVIEHELDFNEEEITHLKADSIQQELQLMEKELSDILEYSAIIKKINQGYGVVILGRPNVGKSTLFNKILGRDKAIVTSIKGTTRDVLEGSIKIKNIPFTFYDTAGYRKTKDIIEGLGIKKSLLMIKEADLVLVVDEKNPKKIINHLLQSNILNKTKKIISVQTKCDALKRGLPIKNNLIKVSAKNGVGINVFLTCLLTEIGANLGKPTYKNIGLCNERQINLMLGAQKTIKRILKDMKRGCSMDIVASGCNDFVQIIEEILGKISSNDILKNIFKGFCVGK